MFAYCENNPVNKVDPDGDAAETVLDVASLGYSAYEFYKKPSWKNFGYVLWDAGAVATPFIPGSYTVKGVKAGAKAAKAAAKTEKATKSAKKVLAAKSSIKKSNSLVKEANKLSGSAQKEINALIDAFRNGNVNPGIGSKHLAGNIYYLRGANGGRVFYRMVDGTMDILGKATKANEQTAIKVGLKTFN
jgi:hypothetical protein